MTKSTIMKQLFTFFLATFIFAGIGINANAQSADSVVVKFMVDVAAFADSTDLDLANDSLYIAGDAWGWAEPGTNHDLMLTDDDNDSVYTFCQKYEKLAVGQYKFFYVPAGTGHSWDFGEWTGGDNRKLTAYGNDGDTLVISNMWGIRATEVQFNVDMATFADTTDFDPVADSVYLSGDVVGWNEPGTNQFVQMYDLDGDLTYSLTLYLDTLDTKEYQYKFFYVPAGTGHSWDYGEWPGGDNRKLTVGADMITINKIWGTFALNFVITSDGTTPVQDADVTVGDVTVVSDVDGLAMFHVTPATSHPFTVTHGDYVDFTGEIAMDYADSTHVVELSLIGIEEGEAAVAFGMYPNPVSSQLTIEGMKDVTRIEIFNTVGQKMNVIENVNENMQIETGHFESGVYFVNFYNERGVIATQKFLKR
jgi:hypothetical protein